MRIFLIKASKARTSPDFNIKSFASSSGRLDVIARAILAALRLSNGTRENVTFLCVLEGPPNPPKLLKVVGSEVEELPESEISIGEIFLRLFKGEKIKGFYLENKSFKEIVSEYVRNPQAVVYYLERYGVDIRDIDFPKGKSLVFILGDHIGLDKESELFLKKMKIQAISLGPKVYFTTHCITIVNEELDRRKLFS
ncbi:MAG: tRNA (pseudouridine(54)-N(1))-methyltransferase TrmY [Thermoprotei archaeon]|nr:MAG: tRNA (pseudouridine(54)-N(1))-methyltransferase TrmY [Thermoprotei archaeon]